MSFFGEPGGNKNNDHPLRKLLKRGSTPTPSPEQEPTHEYSLATAYEIFKRPGFLPEKESEKAYAEATELSEQIVEKNRHGDKIDLKAARSDIDLLVRREIGEGGEEEARQARFFYLNRVQGGANNSVGSDSLAREMLHGYDRWLSRHASSMTERLGAQTNSLVHKHLLWGQKL